MKKNRKKFDLMEIGKLKRHELLLTVLIYVLPVILNIFYDPFFMIMGIFILILINIWLMYMKIIKEPKFKRNNPELYTSFLIAEMVCLIGLVIYFVVTDRFIQGLSLTIAFFAFLCITGIVLYYVYNILYIVLLKKIFPKHSNELIKESFPKLRTLSEYMTLNTQKLYLSLLLLDLFLYFTFMGFVMMIGLKYTNSNDVFIMSSLSDFAKEQSNFFMLFNAIGLLSVILTVYSITIPKRKSIIIEANQKLNQRFRV